MEVSVPSSDRIESVVHVPDPNRKRPLMRILKFREDTIEEDFFDELKAWKKIRSVIAAENEGRLEPEVNKRQKTSSSVTTDPAESAENTHEKSEERNDSGTNGHPFRNALMGMFETQRQLKLMKQIVHDMIDEKVIGERLEERGEDVEDERKRAVKRARSMRLTFNRRIRTIDAAAQKVRLMSERMKGEVKERRLRENALMRLQRRWKVAPFERRRVGKGDALPFSVKVGTTLAVRCGPNLRFNSALERAENEATVVKILFERGNRQVGSTSTEDGSTCRLNLVPANDLNSRLPTALRLDIVASLKQKSSDQDIILSTAMLNVEKILSNGVCVPDGTDEDNEALLLDVFTRGMCREIFTLAEKEALKYYSWNLPRPNIVRIQLPSCFCPENAERVELVLSLLLSTKEMSPVASTDEIDAMECDSEDTAAASNGTTEGTHEIPSWACEALLISFQRRLVEWRSTTNYDERPLSGLTRVSFPRKFPELRLLGPGLGALQRVLFGE